MHEQEKHFYERREGLNFCCCGRDEAARTADHVTPTVSDVYVIECCTHGSGSVVINGKKFEVRAGDCICLFPGDTVSHISDGSCERRDVWCAVYGLNLGKILRGAGITPEQPFAPSSSFSETVEILNELVDTKDEDDMGADFRRTSRVYALIGAMLRTKSVSNENMWVQRAIAFIEASYADDINVSLVAKTVGLERSYFSTLFKERTGLSPSDYLTQFRIKKACALMSNDEFSIAKIAEATGFDPQNFARIFKREVGASPREYRNLVVRRGGEPLTTSAEN